LRWIVPIYDAVAIDAPAQHRKPLANRALHRSLPPPASASRSQQHQPRKAEELGVETLTEQAWRELIGG
jgi:hypothetical protein